jgi:hypothetical protein
VETSQPWVLEHSWSNLRGLFWWNRGVKRSLNNDLDLIPARALQAGGEGVGSPSSPTEGLKIVVFPGKRDQTRHLDFEFLGC